jgi:tRNA G18 (ribose-2'-O)-methylase SpoU
MIDSTDPRLAPYRLVGDPQSLEREGLFVAEGRLVVERLLEDGRFAPHSVLVTPAAAAAMAGTFERRPDVAVLVAAPETLREVTGFNFHRGCLALARRPARQIALSDLAGASRLLAIEGVTDPDNVGGLFRTAFALGVDAVLLDAASGDPLYRKAIRTSMAATLRVPYVRVDAWLDTFDTLRGFGFRIAALTPHPEATPLAEYALRADDRLALVAGSEGFGMSADSLARADVRLRIPIDPRADSLNVVTAAAIALYALAPRT